MIWLSTGKSNASYCQRINYKVPRMILLINIKIPINTTVRYYRQLCLLLTAYHQFQFYKHPSLVRTGSGRPTANKPSTSVQNTRVSGRKEQNKQHSLQWVTNRAHTHPYSVYCETVNSNQHGKYSICMSTTSCTEVT